MVDSKHFQGYSNWASYSFSVVWSNDEDMYLDFIEKGAGVWEQCKGNPTEVGRAVVTYARDHYTGNNEEVGENRFPDLETDAEWEEIDLEEVGDEIREAAAQEGKYADLFAMFD